MPATGAIAKRSMYGHSRGCPAMVPTPPWLQEKLFERRLVFVTGRLDEALASQAAAQIIPLDAAADAPIDVLLRSEDGTLEAAFVLIDVFDAPPPTLPPPCLGH